MKCKIFYLIVLLSLVIAACRQSSTQRKVAASDHTEHKKTTYFDSLAIETNKSNWMRPPYKHWSIKNVDKLFPVGKIAKAETVSALEKLDRNSILDLQVEQFNGEIYGFEEHLDSNRTDGFLVLHKGNIIYEKYFGNMTESSSHNWFSMSKSLTGTTAAILSDEGLIDLQKPIVQYLPELKGTAWDGPSVQSVMDMTVNLKFDEAYSDPKSDAYKFARASHFIEIPNLPTEFDDVLDYFKTVEKGDNHEELFHYVSLNTEVLGMIIKKVTGKQPSKVMSERIWSKIGAEQDAFVVQDPNGYELVSAAINTNLRDAGRFGQLMLNDGFYNGQQIISGSVVQTIKQGGRIEKFAHSKRGLMFKNYSYTNQWWHTDTSAFFAKGLFGQWIYIDPNTETVIVKFTTADIPTSTEYDWMNNMNLMEAIVKHLSLSFE